MPDIGARLRAARMGQELSLRELARRTELSASLLSQIENGKANPSVESLYNIAAALRVPVTTFFSDARPDPSPAVEPARLTVAEYRRAQSTSDPARAPADPAPQITRRDERPVITLMGGVLWERLTARPEAGAEFIETVYPPGASSGLQMSHHEGREFGLVLEGELTLELAFDCFTLRAGDTIAFRSGTPHRLSNRGPLPVRAVWVVLDR